MLRSLFRGLVSACLVALVGAGGGTLPVLDAFAFHDPDARSESLRAHYESQSACHTDSCAVYSTAQQARAIPAPVPAPVVALPLEAGRSAGAVDSCCPAPLTLRYNSRAPPLSS